MRVTAEPTGGLRVLLNAPHSTLVDECDVHWLERHAFQVRLLGRRKRLPYVAAGVNGTTIYLHRAIMSAPKGVQVDHRNKDGTDNRRGNLRLASQSQNCANRHSRLGSSGYRGVSAWGKRWRAIIEVDGVVYRRYSLLTPEAAALAYNEMALHHFGEFAVLNKVPNVAANAEVSL